MKNIKHITLTIILLLFIVTIIFIESSFITTEISIIARIVLLVFFNIFLIALFTLSFFVGKNLFKLYLEKKRKVTGYKFKTRLVTVFIGITLIPSAMLFIIASGLVTNYFDKWVKPQITKPHNDSLSLAKNVYEYIRKNTLSDALEIKKGAKVYIGYNTKKINRPSENMSETIKNAFNGEEGTEIISTGNEDIVRAVVPVWKGKKVSEVLIVETMIPVELSRRVESIQSAFRKYVTIKEFKQPIKANYFIILGFITSLIIFLALWIVLRISRGITEPIQSLAQATEEVAYGNLNTFVESKRDDEIGMLINSFNRMIEEIKVAEISLQQAYDESDKRRLYYENIVNNINSGVISIDADGTIITINGIASKILNIKPGDVLNNHYEEIVKKIDSEDLKIFLKGINLYNFQSIKEQLNLTINGQKMVLRIFIAQLKDSNKLPIGLLVVFNDLTELIKAQKALTWQDVAKRITHEIKNPLTPIKLSTERLLKRWRNGDKNINKIIESSTNTIIREVDALQRLVNEFSRLGQMPDIKPYLSDLKSLINEVIDLYSYYENVLFNLNYNAKSSQIFIDAEQFKRVLINIFDNAVQAMDKKGRVVINVTEDELNENMIIEIIDTGTGIKNEDKDKLFQPYFSKKKDGTGLGLAITHRIVTEHKGCISVSDNKPKGTIFKIEIPCLKRRKVIDG